MLTNFITWNVDPEIFSFWKLHVRWYGLLFAAGFVVGYMIFQRFLKREKQSEELLDKLLLYMVLGTVIGARLGHVLFYQPDYYFANPIEILYVWEGGLASHGGSIGIITALILFCYKFKVPFIWLADRVAIPVAFSSCCIRLGNLMNSEIYGIETSMPWGFIFKQDGQTLPMHPTQIYEALCYLGIFFLMLWLYWKKIDKIKSGTITGWFLILVFTSRFFIEFIKNTQVDFEKGMSLYMGQWLSIPFILLGIGALLYNFKGVPRLMTEPMKK